MTAVKPWYAEMVYLLAKWPSPPLKMAITFAVFLLWLVGCDWKENTTQRRSTSKPTLSFTIQDKRFKNHQGSFVEKDLKGNITAPIPY